MRVWLYAVLLSLGILSRKQGLFYSIFIYHPTVVPTTALLHPPCARTPHFMLPILCLQPPPVCSPHATGRGGEPPTALQQLQSGLEGAERSVFLSHAGLDHKQADICNRNDLNNTTALLMKASSTKWIFCAEECQSKQKSF